jgi:TonB-linked SusC/RagA family outer membrane protein
MKKILLLYFITLFGAMAQESTVRGKIISSEDGLPMAGVNVAVKGTGKGTISNINGDFEIAVEKGKVLSFSFLGFIKQEVTVSSNDFIQVTLEVENTAFGDVVVTALGISREKRSIGYAVQEVKAKEFETRPTNALGALSGKIAGLQVIPSGGNMGGSTRVLLRGINSITGNNQPLFVIDGTPIDNSDLNTSSTINGSAGKDVGNLLQDINPDDIENISVLKGPSAAALYGSRAANGVILITTKKAPGKDRIEVSLNTGLDFENVVRLPQRQQTYGQGYSEIFQTANINGSEYKIVDYASDESWGPKLDGTPVLQWYNLDPENPDQYLKTSPWLYPKNDVSYFFKTGIANTNNLSISASSGNTNYRLSYTNKNVSGTVPNSSLGRNTLSFAGNTRLGKVTVSSNVNYINNRSVGRPWTGASNRNIMLEAFQWGAVQVDYKILKNYKRADGTQIPWNRTSFQNTPAGEATRFIDNPYWSAYESYLEENRDRFYGNFGLDFDVTPWLKVGAKVHGDIYSVQLQDRIAVYSRSQSQYQETNHKLNEYNYELLSTLQKDFNKLSLVANVGANLRTQKRRIDDALTQGGLIIPNFYNLKNATSVLTNNNFYVKRVASAYGSVSLGYDNVAFFDATLRNDWSSTLPLNNNSFLYPSFTGSFILSELKGLRAIPGLSFAKVRLGWAQVGNDTDPYQLHQVYEVQQAFSGIPSYRLPAILNNSALKPEITSSWETGLNLQFLKNRVGLDLTFYNNDSKNQILPVPVSSAFGYDSKVLNAGHINNKGIEITLSGKPIQGGNFEWNTAINFSRNRNKVISLDELVNTLTLSNALVDLVAREGQPYGQIMGYDFVYAKDGQRVVQADGTYQRTSQLVPLGSVLPDFLLGFQNKFSYKNWNLSFLIDSRVGGKFFSQTYKVGMYAGILDKTAANNIRETGVILDGVLANVTFNADGTYSVENTRPNDIKISAINWARNEYSGPTTFSVFDGSFVKLREVVLSRSFPIKNSNVFKSVGFSVYGRNLWNIYTASKYIDPEFTNSGGNVQGIEGGNIPVPVSYGFNINAKF